MRVRLRGFLLAVFVGVCSFTAQAQTDSLVAPKEQQRFKKFSIPAKKSKDSVMVKQDSRPEVLNDNLPSAVAANRAKDSLVLQSKAQPGFLRQAVVPTALITAGVLLSGGAFEKSMNKNVRNAVGNNFHTKIDDYTRYVPVAQMYIADIAGVKSKNHWFIQTRNLAVSLIITDFVTNTLKDNINKLRPNEGMGSQSFPSAHTSQAFTTATVLYEEFKDSSPLLAYSGFAVAGATGAMRMMNNAHWFSDVLVGAGIGIVVTKAVYALSPLVKWNPFQKKNKEVMVLPQIASNEYGVYVGVKF